MGFFRFLGLISLICFFVEIVDSSTAFVRADICRVSKPRISAQQSREKEIRSQNTGDPAPEKEIIDQDTDDSDDECSTISHSAVQPHFPFELTPSFYSNPILVRSDKLEGISITTIHKPPSILI